MLLRTQYPDDPNNAYVNILQTEDGSWLGYTRAYVTTLGATPTFHSAAQLTGTGVKVHADAKRTSSSQQHASVEAF